MMRRRDSAVASDGLEPIDVVLRRGEPGYPARLAATSDAPTLLFVRGNRDVLDLPSIAIVGSRDASHEGCVRAFRLAKLLAQRGIAVTSGLARGIDTAAHLGALSAAGVTMAVIGTPLTRCYPNENAELQRRIGLVGAVVSQFAPSSKTRPWCFPLRNATMSALALGTVVVEAADSSGSLIQARKALEQGRKLFIPRSAFENTSVSWPRKYAALGAQVFASVDDVVASLYRG
jgi:DNA processing protein